MGIESQYMTSKAICEKIDGLTDTDQIIEKVSEVLSGRIDIDQEDYKEIIEYVVLQLNCIEDLSIREISKIANVFRNVEYKDINVIHEAFINSDCRLPINLELDKDGSLLVSKHLTLDYGGVFAQSHRLIKTYASAENIQGVKYELAKQWFLLYLLENKILYNKNKLKDRLISDSKRKQATQIRSFILNDYKTYMKWLMKRNKDFNFNEYFKQTPFYKETYKVDKRLLQMIIPI